MIQLHFDFESKRNVSISIAFPVLHGTASPTPIVRNFSDWLQPLAKGWAQCSSCCQHKVSSMIFRALIAIGIVSLLTPHEPDLGLGRPGAGALQLAPASLQDSASGLSRNLACSIPACAGALGLASAFGLTPSQGRSLNDVKAEIEAARKARGY